MLSFTRVPIISKSLQINRNDSDRQRKLYAKSVTKGMTTLERLDATSKKKSNLDYCSAHNTYNESFNIPYRDLSNKKNTFVSILKVPIDVKKSSMLR